MLLLEDFTYILSLLTESDLDSSAFFIALVHHLLQSLDDDVSRCFYEVNWLEFTSFNIYLGAFDCVVQVPFNLLQFLLLLNF